MKADSAPRLALRWIAAHGVLLKPVETEAELRRTLASPKLAALLQRGGYVAALLGFIEAAELVDPVVPLHACRDADDDKFLSLAVSGRADLIVSGDQDLLAIPIFRGIPILAPAAFMDRVAAWR